MDSILIVGIGIMSAVLWALHTHFQSLQVRPEVKSAVIQPRTRPAIRTVLQPVAKPELIDIIQRIEASQRTEASQQQELQEKTEDLIRKWNARKYGNGN